MFSESLKIDRDKAAILGMTAQDVTQLMSFTLGGMRLSRFNAGEREIETWLALRLEDRSKLEDLQQLPLTGRDGRSVLLGDIATFEQVVRPHQIERENRKVRVAVRGTYDGENWDQASEQITALMNTLNLRPGYSWGWNDRIIE